MFKNDFLMREIENFSKFVIKLFRKENMEFETDQEHENSIEDDLLFYRFQEMIYTGKINEAENALFEIIEKEPKLGYLKLSEKFYSEVVKMSDEYLQRHHYSREEIFESLDQIKQIYEEKYSDSENGIGKK
jgi:hypothetical protein